MTPKPITIAWYALLFLTLMAPVAQADLPANRVVEYDIREDPEDEESDVLWRFGFKLTAVSRTGETVDWDIVEVRIKDRTGSPVHLYIDDNPDTPTANGYWTITHVDADLPEDSEFAVTPLMSGTARAQDENDDDLDYDIEGGTYSPPPSLFGGDVSQVDFDFTFVGESTPEIEGDEPVAIDDDVDPASGE